jgi:hypothetical protein
VCHQNEDRQLNPRDVVSIFSQPGFSPRILQPLKIFREERQLPALINGAFDACRRVAVSDSRFGGRLTAADTQLVLRQALSTPKVGFVGCSCMPDGPHYLAPVLSQRQ